MAIERYSGQVSDYNSTIIPLSSFQTFTGKFEDVLHYSSIIISLLSDTDSLNDGLEFQWSNDGINLIFKEVSSCFANIGRSFSLAPRARYFRIVYINGVNSQSNFSLQTIYNEYAIGLVSRPLDRDLTGENFAQTVRSVINGKNSFNAYIPIKATDTSSIFVNLRDILGNEIGVEDKPLIVDSSANTELNYNTLIDETQNTFTYIGRAKAGSLISDPLWQIIRIQEITNKETIISLANNSKSFNKIWQNRYSYTYHSTI